MATQALYEANTLGTVSSTQAEDREMFKLASSISQQMGTGTPRVLVFSPVDDNESASEVAARFATTLALTRQQSTVCLIDGNFQAPSLHRLFPKTASLEAALSSEQAFRQLTQSSASEDGLLVLAAGTQPGTKSALAHQLKHFLQAQTTGLVILVAPPAQDLLFFAEFSPVIDGVILVLEAHRTRRKLARTSAKDLQTLDLPVLGAVLTGRTFPIPEFIYKRL